MLKLVHGDVAVTMKSVYEYKCFKRFRNGWELVEEEERSGLLSTSKTQGNVEKVSEMTWSNRRLTIREISKDLNTSYVRRKRPEKWGNGFILHHDNAPWHTSLLVGYFLSNKNIKVCPQPPYSPGLAPCDFWLFPKVKMTIKDKRFESIQDMEVATTVQLKTLTKEVFQNCFRKWQERWDKCVRSEG
jgi:transposase